MLPRNKWYNFCFKIKHDQAHFIIHHSQNHGQNETMHQDRFLPIVTISYLAQLLPCGTSFRIITLCFTFIRMLGQNILFKTISIANSCSRSFIIEGGSHWASRKDLKMSNSGDQRVFHDFHDGKEFNSILEDHNRKNSLLNY